MFDMFGSLWSGAHSSQNLFASQAVKNAEVEYLRRQAQEARDLLRKAQEYIDAENGSIIDVEMHEVQEVKLVK